MTLGSEVKDKITGFKGILTAKATYITGCDQYLVQPPVLNSAFVESRWFDKGRLEVISTFAIDPKNVQSDENGCDIPAPIK